LTLLAAPLSAQQPSLALRTTAPPPPSFIGASYSGQPGPGSYYYWVSAVYPGGESGVAGPALVRGVANTLGGGNTVDISWSAAFGATAYNVIRTQTSVFPGNCTSCLLASGVTSTTTSDTGASLSSYVGGAAAAPANAGLAVNVRDYASPRLEVTLNGSVVATFDASGIASGGGGGTLASLSDVDTSGASDGSVLLKSGSEWVDSAVLTLANGSASAPTYSFSDDPDTGFFRDSGTGAIRFTYGGSQKFGLTSTQLLGLVTGAPLIPFGTGSPTAPTYAFNGNSSYYQSGMYMAVAGEISFSSTSEKLFQIGGSQTALIQDTTATTGDTSFIVKAGAGQAANLQEWQNNSGTVLAYVNKDGEIQTASSGGFTIGAGAFGLWKADQLSFRNTGAIGWSGTSGASSAKDIGIARLDAGVLKATDGSTGYGSAMMHQALLASSDTGFSECDGDDGGFRFDTSEGRIKVCEDDSEEDLVTADDIIVYIPIPIDDTAAASTGDGKATLSVGSELNGYVLTSVRVTAFGGGTTSGLLNIDLTRCTPSGATGCNTAADMLSTNLTLDVSETSSATAATAAVINTSNDDLSTGQFIRVDIDAVHGTAATGVEVAIGLTPGS